MPSSLRAIILVIQEPGLEPRLAPQHMLLRLRWEFDFYDGRPLLALVVYCLRQVRADVPLGMEEQAVDLW